MADGPGFHVWEETHGEAVASAAGLASSLRPSAPCGAGGTPDDGPRESD
ncbi:MAG: hypothetical protein ACQGVK_15800 [Myxococcota bacterium]